MTADTTRLTRMCLSSVIAGAMAAGTSLLSALSASGGLPKGTVTIALISGGLIAAKDVQSYLSTPPTGGAQ